MLFKYPKKATIDDEYIFVVNSEKKLSLRSIEVIDRQKNTVIIKSNINEGELIVVSDTRVLKQDLTVEINELNPVSLDNSDNVDIEKLILSEEIKSDTN